MKMETEFPSCRSVDNFEKLGRIQEGSYGIVYRAKDKESEEVVALKRIKMDKHQEGI
jgi:serine/threonine protein kinase